MGEIDGDRAILDAIADVQSDIKELLSRQDKLAFNPMPALSGMMSSPAITEDRVREIIREELSKIMMMMKGQQQ